MVCARDLLQLDHVAVRITTVGGPDTSAGVLRWAMKGHARSKQPLVFAIDVGDVEAEMGNPRVAHATLPVARGWLRREVLEDLEVGVALTQHDVPRRAVLERR